MPTYQYACTTTDCGHRFELVQSFTDPAATDCPTCGGPVRKVFSAVGVVFKGSGFYRTDSRSTNGSKSESKSSSTGSGDSSSTSTPKESSSSTSSTSASSATSTSSSTSSSSGKVAAGA